MNTLAALGLTLAAISVLIRLLAAWCRPVKFTELSRFPGNDAAAQSYENRLAAAGIGKVRNVRVTP